MISARRNRGWAALAVVAILMTLAATASPAQTFKTLVNFNGTDGALPQFLSLVQGTDGNLYGSTFNGGDTLCGFPLGCGTLFKMTPTGTLMTLYNFCAQSSCTDGAFPLGLALGTDENFYGTTFEGGTSNSCTLGCGTVFKITRSGALTALHSFDLTDGAHPQAALIQASDGNLYGTTLEGGSSNFGTVFKITPAGTFTSLHSFDFTDGDSPAAALLQGTDGNLYGTTGGGGFDGSSYCAVGCGTVFKITPSGALTTLHEFDFTDGANPAAPLIQASDGNFYGTTFEGGANYYGTAFKITRQGVLNTLHGFDWSDGAGPAAALVQATDGNFYGTTNAGSSGGGGSIFTIAPRGTLTTLYSFGGFSADGLGPNGLVQATNGTFYGTTAGDGTTSEGTVFSEATGLGPFVTTLPTSRQVGQRVAILGNNLTGATSVSFSGTAAVFTVVSSTEIATTVPDGAITGTVQVVTPHGRLSSNVPFRVTP